MDGHEGWDDYAPFYDWENAQTLGKRDVPFWKRLARQCFAGRSQPPHLLELGCGTGRVAFPLARDGVSVIGVDRSAEMLAFARRRQRRLRKPLPLALVRADVRALPFPARSFPLIIAPYGMLQSLLAEDDLTATLDAVAAALAPGGTFGLELVADLPAWREYDSRVTLRGKRRNGARITLTESVRQDRVGKLTLFDQQYVERHGRKVVRKRFSLSFRTLTIPEMASRLESAGLVVSALLGDYRGSPWDIRAEAWIILARKPRRPSLRAKRAAGAGAAGPSRRKKSRRPFRAE